MAEETVFRLQGMSCANCARKFEQNIRTIDTVTDAHVNFGAAKVSVKGKVSIEQLEKAGAFENIKVFPESEPSSEKVSIFKKRENLVTLLSFVLLVIGIMVQFYIGASHPLVIGIYVAAITVGGYRLFITGVKNLFQFYFDMKTLMTIAIIGAAFIGEWIEGAIVVLLFALSEALESYSIDKARQSITSLIDVAPKRATIKRETETVKLDVKDIQIGDVMVIKPGEKIAMDGVVISGQTSVNQAAITGESLPVFKSVGDEV